MSTRITLVVVNNTGSDVVCADTHCESFDNLEEGTVIKNGTTGTFSSSTNDRIFATFVMEVGAGGWEMGMTCPKSSSNSAYGTAKAGLQPYSRSGTPCTFTYVLGEENQADWDNGDSYTRSKGLRYGDCS